MTNELLTRAGGTALGAVFAAGAAVRRGKVLHPDGAVFEARLVVPGAAPAPAGAELLATPGEHRGFVRFSRGIGLPRPLPDLLGLALRVLDAYGPEDHQDLLLTSSSARRIVHHGFLPARDVQDRPYSSALPFRAGGERFLIGALPCADSPRPPGATELDRARAAARTGRLRFELAVARPGRRFEPVADLHVGAPLPAEYDAVAFDPWRTGGGLEPAGSINAMRRRVYPLAHAAWRRRRAV